MANVAVAPPEADPPILLTDSMDFPPGCSEKSAQTLDQESIAELLSELLCLHGRMVAACSCEVVRADRHLAPGSEAKLFSTTSLGAATCISKSSTPARPTSAGRLASPSPGMRRSMDAVDSMASRNSRALSLSQEDPLADDEFDEELRFPLQPQLLSLEKKSSKSTKKSGHIGHIRSNKTVSTPVSSPAKELKSRWVLNPSSCCRLCWDALSLLMLLQDMILSPLHVFEASVTQEAAQRTWIWAADMFWSLDVVLSFFTAVHVNGTLVQDHAGIAKAYLKSWLLFDLFILIPDLLSFFFYDDSGVQLLGVMRLIRTGRLLRLLRFLRLLRVAKLKPLLEALSLHGHLSSSQHFALDVGKYVFGMLYGLHLLTCLWYMAGNVPDGWVVEEGLQPTSLSSTYFASLTIALSRLPASSMRWNMRLQTDGERTLAIIATFMALGMSSVCVSKVTNVMARWQSARQQRQQIIQSLRDYCACHGVEFSHVVSMKKYAERELARKEALQAHTNLLSTFSNSMLQTLFHQARASFLRYHKDFADWCAFSRVFEFSICNKAMKEQYSMRHDCIFIPAEPAEGMYLMATVQCSYEFDSLPVMPRFGTNPMSSSGARWCFWNCLNNPAPDVQENVIKLAAGDHISEHALWVAGWNHRGRLQATADGWVLTLLTSGFMDTLKEHPSMIGPVLTAAKKYAAIVNTLAEISDEQLSDLPIGVESETEQASRSVKLQRPRRRSVLPDVVLSARNP